MSIPNVDQTRKKAYNYHIAPRRYAHIDSRILMNYSEESVYKKQMVLLVSFLIHPLAPAGLPLV